MREWVLNILSNKRIFARFKGCQVDVEKEAINKINKNAFKLVITLFGSWILNKPLLVNFTLLDANQFTRGCFFHFLMYCS